MSAFSNNSSLAAYRSVAVHGSVDAADPHRLILMLMDGALERIASARGAIDNGLPEVRNRLLQRAGDIVFELRGSLNLEAGGQLSANLADLYEYVARLLVRANAESRSDLLEEAGHLLRQIRGAWAQIPPGAAVQKS